jgi:hypothetical protein
MGENNNDNKFVIKEYVEWVSDASVRTRTVSIILVIATVLIAIGFYNSLQWSWARDRLKRVYDMGDTSIYTLMDAKNHPKFESDSFFAANDFNDFKSLAFKLGGNRNDQLSEYIYARLSLNSKILLTHYLLADMAMASGKKPSPSDALLDAVAADFNKLLTDKNLYFPPRFEKIRLKSATKQFLRFAPGGSDLIRFNRLLLEDYFPDELGKSQNVSPLDDYRKEIQRYTVLAYVENIRYIKVPFFGISFDVNDLGPIGGFGLVIILMMYRYSLSREIKNLRYAFATVRRRDREEKTSENLNKFYHALAMMQVFTVPEMKALRRNRKLASITVIIPLMPAVIFTLGMAYDWRSVYTVGLYTFNDAAFTLSIEFLWLVLIWYYALRCAGKILHIDKIWRIYWRVLIREKSEYSKNRLAGKIRKFTNYIIFSIFLKTLSAKYKARENITGEIENQPAGRLAGSSETTKKSSFGLLPLIVFLCFFTISAGFYLYTRIYFDRLTVQSRLITEGISFASLLVSVFVLLITWRKSKLEIRLLENELKKREDEQKKRLDEIKPEEDLPPPKDNTDKDEDKKEGKD